MQTEAKAGQTHYKGLFNAFSVITKEEGVKALFKGGVPRMIRSSPQSVESLLLGAHALGADDFLVLFPDLPSLWSYTSGSKSTSPYVPAFTGSVKRGLALC